MFPGANAQVYRNEAGEPIGWDYPSEEPDYDYWEDQDNNWDLPEFETVEECIEERYHGKDGEGIDGWWVCDYCHIPFREMEDDFLD